MYPSSIYVSKFFLLIGWKSPHTKDSNVHDLDIKECRDYMQTSLQQFPLTLYAKLLTALIFQFQPKTTVRQAECYNLREFTTCCNFVHTH